MKWKRVLSFALSLVITLSLLPILAGAAPLTQAPASDKVEGTLVDAFAAEGTADFAVIFVEQADLSPAYSMGWEERGPYDGILATAAPERVPEELLRQLAPGGRLVIPVGGEAQHLQVVTRSPEGYDTEIVEAVNFVPLRPGTVR